MASKTFYIRTTGSDANNGLTKEKAFKTINRAIAESALLSPGSNVLIYIGAGEYCPNTDNPPWIRINGAIGNLSEINFSFIGDIRGVMTGDAGSVCISAFTSSATYVGTRQLLLKYLTFIGFLPSSNPTGYYGSCFIGSGGTQEQFDQSIATIDSCIFKTPQNPPPVGVVPIVLECTAVVKNCLFDVVGGQHWGGSRRMIAGENNVYLELADHGGLSGTISVYNNTFIMRNNIPQVVVWPIGEEGTITLNFYNNLIVGGGQCAIIASFYTPGLNLTLNSDYNYYERNQDLHMMVQNYTYKHSIGDMRTAGHDIHSMHVGVDSSAGSGALVYQIFRLPGNSPCVDAGTNVGVLFDIFGHARTNPDIGCFEYTKTYVAKIAGTGNSSVTRCKFQFGQYRASERARGSLLAASTGANFAGMNLANVDMTFATTKNPYWNVIIDGYNWM